MSYTITLTNGTTLIPGGLSDGTADTTHSSLTLIGRDYAGYGQFLNENFVYLLENFSYTTPPNNPLVGQLWWNSSSKTLNIYTGTSWKIPPGSTSASSPPTDVVSGDLWYDSTNAQLKVWSGTTWIVVGPVATSSTPNTGTIPAIVVDSSNVSHVVIQFTISGTVYAIFAYQTFSISNITGFSVITPGLNFASGYNVGLNTQSITAVNGTLVQRDPTNGIINVAGVSSTGAISGTTISASTINVSGLSSISASGVISGTTINAGAFAAATGTANFYGNLTGNVLTSSQPGITSLGALTGLTLSGNIVPSANLTYNIGSTTAWWNNIYGTAVHAQYADLAERFQSDGVYTPGTVMEIGGVNEVTQVVNDLSENVFGVISTDPAYLMNGSAGNDQNYPPIALSGRVPVRVTGVINKGDRLVSAGNGLARSGKPSELTPRNVIGRSLIDKIDDGVGVVEAIVRINL